MDDPSPTAEDATTAACYRHPGRQTRLSCAECGRPICVECSIEGPSGQKCPECARHVGRGQVIDARSRRSTMATTAPVTMLMLGVNVVIYVVGMVAPEAGDQLFRWMAQANWLVEEGEWWRMLTAAFLHAGFTHILFNGWALYVFGPRLEQQVGSAAFLGLYLASAVAGGAAAYLLGDIGDVVVGASGAIFGLFGAWLFSAWRVRHTRMGRALFQQLVVLLAINAMLPLIAPRISWQGHLGGLVAGVVIASIWSRTPARTRSDEMIRAGSAAVVGLIAMILATIV